MIEIDTHPNDSKLRAFGWIATVFFGFWSCWSFEHHAWFGLSLGLALLAGFAFIGAMVNPRILRWMFVGLTLIAFPLGWIVSHILLLCIFFFLFLPIGLVLRLFGHDPMQRKIQRTTTAWKECKSQRPAQSYYHPY